MGGGAASGGDHVDAEASQPHDESAKRNPRGTSWHTRERVASCVVWIKRMLLLSFERWWLFVSCGSNAFFCFGSHDIGAKSDELKSQFKHPGRENLLDRGGFFARRN